MNLRSVAEAAAELDVSPRRVLQLLASGRLRGEQLGWGWVVDPADVDRLRRHRRRAGRPWSPASAWVVLSLANGDEPDVSAVERSRGRKRLGELGLAGLVGRLHVRAELQRYYAHPSALDRLAREPAVVLGGVSAASEYDAGLIAHEFVEAYVARGRLSALVKRYGLDADVDRPNVAFRVVDDAVWPFHPDAELAPWPVVAVDLMEADDERSQRAGRDMLERRA